MVANPFRNAEPRKPLNSIQSRLLEQTEQLRHTPSMKSADGLINLLETMLRKLGPTSAAQALANMIVSDDPPMTIDQARRFEGLIAQYGGFVSPSGLWVNWMTPEKFAKTIDFAKAEERMLASMREEVMRGK